MAVCIGFIGKEVGLVSQLSDCLLKCKTLK